MTSLSRFQANPEPQSSIKQLQQEWDSNTIVPSPPYVDPRISHAYGRSIKELRYTTLAPLIDSMCQREPHSTAVLVYDEGICKSFEKLNADINKVVNGMVEKLNLRVGDRVGIYSYNTYQCLLTHYACNKLGITMNPFNPSFKVH